MSVRGFRARNHPQQVRARRPQTSALWTDDDVDPIDEVDDRRTPADLLAECLAFAELDAVDLDVAASSANTKAPRFYDRAANGLVRPWSGRVWCNPPYSAIRPWLVAAHREASSCERIVVLLPANRTEQSWWTELVEPFREDVVRTRFLAGRRRFGHPRGWTPPARGDRPPFGLVVLVWGMP